VLEQFVRAGFLATPAGEAAPFEAAAEIADERLVGKGELGVHGFSGDYDAFVAVAFDVVLVAAVWCDGEDEVVGGFFLVADEIAVVFA